MTTNHIDQLTEWWDGAEIPNADTLPRDGDRIIVRYNSEWYEIATADGDADESEIGSNARILARAPKPKPAWHDAVAVIAHKDGECGLTAREVYVSGVDDKWESAHYYARTSELIDPVPLIEAKVTDEMVDAAYGYAPSLFPGKPTVRRLLAAALGLYPA